MSNGRVGIAETEMTVAEMRERFPELFKIAAQLRARDSAVRLHSFRIAVGEGQDRHIVPVRVKKEPG